MLWVLSLVTYEHTSQKYIIWDSTHIWYIIQRLAYKLQEYYDCLLVLNQNDFNIKNVLTTRVL